MEKVAKQVLKRNRKKLFILSFEWSDDDRLAAIEVFEEIFKNKISANVPPPGRPAPLFIYKKFSLYFTIQWQVSIIVILNKKSIAGVFRIQTQGCLPAFHKNKRHIMTFQCF